MSRFKIGDRVKFIDRDQTGVIQAMEHGWLKILYDEPRKVGTIDGDTVIATTCMCTEESVELFDAVADAEKKKEWKDIWDSGSDDENQ